MEETKSKRDQSSENGASVSAEDVPANTAPIDSNRAPTPPATQMQKAILALWLLIFLSVLFLAWTRAVSRVETILQTETRVAWMGSTAIALKPGPPSFRYDVEGKQLVHVGIIDRKLKQELIDLIPENAPGEILRSYWTAVDKLAFDSNQGLIGLMVSLLWVGGLSGALGVQLRSLTNYVGVACFKNALEIGRWWPYYVVRPFTGFILGIVVVVIIQAGLFKVGDSSPVGTLWWVSIALLAGFGADEFTQRLRSLTQTLFGMSEK